MYKCYLYLQHYKKYYLKLHDFFEHNILKVKSILALKFLQPQSFNSHNIVQNMRWGSVDFFWNSQFQFSNTSGQRA